MEKDLWWKTTFDGGRPLMEKDIWKTTIDGRKPLMKDGPLMENNLRWKKLFDGS